MITIKQPKKSAMSPMKLALGKNHATLHNGLLRRNTGHFGSSFIILFHRRTVSILTITNITSAKSLHNTCNMNNALTWIQLPSHGKMRHLQQAACVCSPPSTLEPCMIPNSGHMIGVYEYAEMSFLWLCYFTR